MEFNKEQKKIINYKPHGHLLIKGEKLTGKTTIIINKIPMLLNHYCIEKNDKILIAAYDEQHLRHISYIYDNIESEKYHQNSFFDEDNSDKLEIRTIESLIIYYFNKYKKDNNIEIIMASAEECEKQLKDSMEIIKKKYEKNKFDLLDYENIEFVKEEIAWIKSCSYLNINDYQTANRIGRINRLNNDARILRKNSKQRQAIYEVLDEYNKKLGMLNKVDLQDMALLALESAKGIQTKKYTHIVIDDCEKLTRVQLEFLKALYNDKVYSSLNFTLNTDSNMTLNAWITNGRSFASLGYDMKGKSISLKGTFADAEKSNENKIIAKEMKHDNLKKNTSSNKSFVLDTIEYIDLKHNVSHRFIKDSGNIDEIYIEANGIDEKVEDVISIPLFNEIAAGNPILINDEVDENYYLPKEWIKNTKGTFMLKVKGDSMINKNINDGDYVIISNQSYPNVKDIVAVDIEGEATLKTYKIINGKITLMPENEKYDPIIIEDQQFSFLGVAIGLVKNS
ncbi:LexA family transcriptional regulator [Clostridium sp. BL-8]|uniref:LexA family protein n=1 Tax=Clostridium sp. BL-8 TaxID=349938 RepID=UPI00098CBD67|nr:LexA family transcriptional regulator [Clostridium sp. BL-8]OOM80727.1 LexA repressor [Clostridium sp. BL-8]